MFLKCVMVLMIMKPVGRGEADADPPKGVEGSEVEIMAVSDRACVRVLRCSTVSDVPTQLQVRLSFTRSRRHSTFNV